MSSFGPSERRAFVPITSELIRSNLDLRLNEARNIIGSVTGVAIKGGIDPVHFDHLDSVWDSSHWTVLPFQAFGPGPRALTDTSSGDVYLREDKAKNLHTIGHESIHRAAVLSRLRNGYPFPEESVRNLFGVEIVDESTSQIVDIATNLLIEGITEWTLERANGLPMPSGRRISIPSDGRTYLRPVAMIKEIWKEYKTERRRLEALLVQTGLTGDFEVLLSHLNERLPIVTIISKHVQKKLFLRNMGVEW